MHDLVLDSYWPVSNPSVLHKAQHTFAFMSSFVRHSAFATVDNSKKIITAMKTGYTNKGQSNTGPSARFIVGIPALLYICLFRLAYSRKMTFQAQLKLHKMLTELLTNQQS